jgi:hypothetical protein
MKTKLDCLLEAIDPARTLDRVASRIDEAVNSFVFTCARVDSFDQFEKLMADFYNHLSGQLLGLRGQRPWDQQMSWGLCVKLLTAEYGERGRNVAYEMARSGVNGGLSAVCRAVAQRMADDHAENLVKAKVSEYWHGLTLNEKLAAPKEYIEKYGSLLPPEAVSDGGILIQASFPQALSQHPYLIRRLRSLGR